ncbi:kinase [Marinilabiliaceae bacterium JC017]|nr:kinase [Marinilabiliaceae bacterium JC017]
MKDVLTAISHKGKQIEWIDECIASGTMKDVFFSPDKSYVVGFYRDKDKFDARAKDRLQTIVGVYKDRIIDGPNGDYWEKLLCWPYDTVEYRGCFGVVVPTYRKDFFFSHGSINNDFLGIKGKEKNGKWFASAKNQNRFLDTREKGDLLSYLRISILLSRATKRLHAGGLAHSDLSYNNVLIDPEGRNACIIDIDGLVVPGKYPPDVMGTPDFVAPEVIKTKHLPLGDPNRILPSILTDRHALSVLIYMYLLFRHPLKGGKIYDQDPVKDEEMAMGHKALFIEHFSDKSNRPNLNDVHPAELPYADVDKLPYTILGPYLKELFDKAFIDGLHDPQKRPTANEWEDALIKTVDLLQPCLNPHCSHKWFVFDNKLAPKCPYCNTPYTEALPVLNFYSSRSKGNYLPDNYRLMIYNNQYLYQWHTNRLVFPNEKLADPQKKPVGYFVKYQGKWVLVNQNLPDLYDVTNKKEIPIGKYVILEDNGQILLDKANGGRLVLVQMVNN